MPRSVYELDVWDSILGQESGFALRHPVQTDTGVHLDSCQMDTEFLTLGVKRPERKSDYSAEFNVEVTNSWNLNSFSSYVLTV
jgi:hypothetical protein